MTPNRYGAKGSRNCQHRVPLWQVCERCNKLLERIENPDQDNPHCQDPEFPTLFGTGNVVDFEQLVDDAVTADESEYGDEVVHNDPVAELEQLGDAGIDEEPPEGGSSARG